MKMFEVCLSRSVLMVAIFFQVLPACVYAHSFKKFDRSPYVERDFPRIYPERVAQVLTKLPPHSLDRCSKESHYLEALRNLEQAVAMVLANEPSIQTTINDLGRRTYQFIRLWTEYRADTPDQSVNLVLEAEFGQALARTPGLPGRDAHSIRNAFMEGNLREVASLLRDGAHTFFINAFESAKICDHLEAPIFEEFKPSLVKVCSLYQSGIHVLDRGRFSYINKFLKRKRDASSYDQNQTEFLVKDLLIPLSQRELDLLEQEGLWVIRPDGNAQILWQNGRELFEPLVPAPHVLTTFDPENLYLSTAERFGFSFIAAPSGSLDSILTIAYILGVSSQAELENLRGAALAVYYEGQHHSSYEVLVSGKSFEGLDIPLNSDYYRHLFTDRPDIEKKIETTFRALSPDHPELPTEVLLKCLTRPSLPE